MDREDSGPRHGSKPSHSVNPFRETDYVQMVAPVGIKLLLACAVTDMEISSEIPVYFIHYPAERRPMRGSILYTPVPYVIMNHFVKDNVLNLPFGQVVAV